MWLQADIILVYKLPLHSVMLGLSLDLGLKAKISGFGLEAQVFGLGLATQPPKALARALYFVAC